MVYLCFNYADLPRAKNLSIALQIAAMVLLLISSAFFYRKVRWYIGLALELAAFVLVVENRKVIKLDLQWDIAVICLSFYSFILQVKDIVRKIVLAGLLGVYLIARFMPYSQHNYDNVTLILVLLGFIPSINFKKSSSQQDIELELQQQKEQASEVDNFYQSLIHIFTQGIVIMDSVMLVLSLFIHLALRRSVPAFPRRYWPFASPKII